MLRAGAEISLVTATATAVIEKSPNEFARKSVKVYVAGVNRLRSIVTGRET